MNFKPNNSILIYNLCYVYIMYSSMYMGFVPEINLFVFFTDEFSKMKSEVPLGLVEAHMRTVDEAVREGRDIAAANYQLEKTGIAGTEKEEVAASPAEGTTATPTPGTTTEQGRL